MIRRLSLLGLVWVLVWSGTAMAAESIRVMLLPFEIRSPQDLSYLSQEIPSKIKGQLAADGADVVMPTAIPHAFSGHETEIRSLAMESGAGYAVWGRLVFEDAMFALTAMVMDTTGQRPVEPLTFTGEGIESLPGAVRTLSSELGDKLFQRLRIAEIRVSGNRRIEADAIQIAIKTKVGDAFNARRLSDDLKAVYAMGYFEDIRIDSTDSPGGRIITFQVKEKPTIKDIDFKGNLALSDDKLKENLDIRAGSILNINALRKNMQRIEVAYKEKKYHNVKVSYETKELNNHQINLIFIIEEGEKVQIKEITFVGNKAYSTKKLKKMMKTAEKGFFSWISSAGEFNRDQLNQDLGLLTAFYHNSGYVQARFAEPEVVQKENWIYITIKLSEGDRFTVASVDVEGELILPKAELLSTLQISKEKYFNREVLRKDMLVLNEIYSNYGYAYADASPDIKQDLEKKEVLITYVLEKGEQVYFDKIIIAGNLRTRDNVIRRELEVEEQGLYSGARLKRSVRNLNRLNFFQDIKVDTVKGESPNTMTLKLNVEEKQTGTFTIGGGYSSVENVFLTGSISQDNLFGRGQKLTLRTQIGGTTNQFILGFTEPWLYDIPLSMNINAYKWSRDYDEYERDSAGGSFRLSYPIFTDTRLFGGYSFDVGEITDVDELEASQDILELTGTFITSAVSTGITFDNRDRIINPTRGHDHRLSLEYAGIGGDIGFAKITGDLGYYYPLIWEIVGFAHLKAGYVSKNSGMTLPDYEKFYLGGINSIRGFDWRDINLKETVYRDTDGNPDTPLEAVEVETGGEAMIQANVELIFPVAKSAGIVGVVFFDTGNVFKGIADIEFGELRQTAGFGIRWYSPMGPIRFEYGHVLDPKPEDDASGKWEFTMGTAF